MKQTIALVILMASLGFSLSISGYNNCYVATPTGFDNINSSSLEFHIDSALKVATNTITYRNRFANGYIAHSDWDGGMDFFRRNDSVIWTDTTKKYIGFVFKNELITHRFGSQNTTKIYTADSILVVDTLGLLTNDKELSKDLFLNDSLYRYSYNFATNAFIPNQRCVSLENECNCGYEVFKFYRGFFETVVNGVVSFRYYTTEKPAASRITRTSSTKRDQQPTPLYKANGVELNSQNHPFPFRK